MKRWSGGEHKFDDKQQMSLKSKIGNAAEPIVIYEVIPPRLGAEGELESRLEVVREVAGIADAINIPEIHPETSRGPRPGRLPERMEPRLFAQAIRETCGTETVVNRVTVHVPEAEQRRWLREVYQQYGIRNLILVGGESPDVKYPGPSVVEMASLVQEEGLPLLLGGITIPDRPNEVERVLEKRQRGICFFTTQVLLDSRAAVELIRGLDGREARIVLSFTPLSHPRDLDFLKWLGVEVPAGLAAEIRQQTDPAEAVEKSFALARQILREVFENLPPRPPALGLQVERITKRNSSAALRMLTELGTFYRQLLQERFPATEIGVGPSPARCQPLPQPSPRK